jgi:ribosomal protein S18 acetylase RimI-like enzyme
VTAAEPAVVLRPAREDDGEFLGRVYASTRTDELVPVPWSDEQKAGFLAQQFEAQTADYARNHPDASFDVVLVDGEPAGRLIVARRERELLVVDIALLPEFRSRGIGTGLLRPILDEASDRGVPVVIHVERFNPALSLYLQLGFVPVEEDAIYLRLERPPVAKRRPTDGP